MLKKSDSTKIQKRVNNRKHDLIKLCKDNRIFCSLHSQYLEAEDIEEHFCYTGNNGKRVCPTLRIETIQGVFVPYKQWASNNKKSNGVK